MRYLLRGFTLVELMVTLAVGIILLSVAVPGYRLLMQSNARGALASDMSSSLALARSEAVNRSTTISLCPSSNGTACQAVAWESGWIMFVNTDADSPPVIDAGETILRVASGSGVVTVNPGAAYAQGVSFSARGSVSSLGSFTVCEHGTAKRTLSVSMLGLVSSSAGGSCE